MSKLVNKLVKASGGWERLFYQTLKDVCEKVSYNGFTGDGEDSIDEAQEILEVYEEMRRQPKVAVSTPVVKTQAQVVVEVDESAKPAQPDKFESHKAKVEAVEVESKLESKPMPKKLTVKVRVDKDVGASQGELPVPANHKVVNRENLVITTTNMLELGKGSSDGQVRGPGVSGQITSNGKYRLAFKDTNIGIGLVHFEVMPVLSSLSDNKK